METPCDYGDCPFNAQGGYDCRNYCGLGVDENDYPEEEEIMSRCDNCGGEDCACCEVFIEEQEDIRRGTFYEDGDIDPFNYFNDRDDRY
ncbi:MAG: hypothetical protein K0Q47_40 [Sedimentibacter sp.]|jgi:hypothetical protein|nr:hypothetical protein [Sedimentibacter sp.]